MEMAMRSRECWLPFTALEQCALLGLNKSVPYSLSASLT